MIDCFSPGMTSIQCATSCGTECGLFHVSHTNGTCVTFSDILYVTNSGVGFTSDPDWTAGYNMPGKLQIIFYLIMTLPMCSFSKYWTWIKKKRTVDDFENCNTIIYLSICFKKIIVGEYSKNNSMPCGNVEPKAWLS